MTTELERFTQQLHDKWLPDFCLDPRRKFSLTGFRDSSITLTEFDAHNFLRAIESGLVYDTGGGRYRCTRSQAQEQIFWEGLKSIEPRSLTLWMEPIITIGTIARLGLDFGWAAEALGMQSKDWAFDFVVYQSATDMTTRIAGEVKKSEKEVDALIADLRSYGLTGATAPLSQSPRHINSFKKWVSLVEGKSPLFWTVGPGDYTRLFEVLYESNETARFLDVNLSKLSTTN